MSEERELPSVADPRVDPQLLTSRLTVVETVYHQPAESPPVTMTGDAVRFSRELASDEQAYERRQSVGEAWESLNPGWIEKCGMLLLRNDEGQFMAQPTDEQRQEVMARVIEVAFFIHDVSKAAILVPPGESCRFCPAEFKHVWLRCRQGKARYTLCLIPE